MSPRRPSLLVTAVALLALAACTRDGGDPPLAARPPPAHLAAIATVPSLDHGLDGVAAIADAVRPGTGAALRAAVPGVLADMVEAKALDGLDPAKPVRAVLLDEPGAEPTLVLVVAVRDRAALTRSTRGLGVRVHRGWAAIGPRAAVEAVAPWALNTLVREAAPFAPTVVAFPAVLLAAHADAIAGFRAALTANLAATGNAQVTASLAGIVDGPLAAFGQADRLTLTLDASATGVELDLAFAARPGTALAGFAAAQQPSTFPLLAFTPAAGASLYAAGHLALGPLRVDAMQLMEPFFAPMFGGAITDAQRASLDALFDAATGEVAMVGAMGKPMRLTALYGVTDRGPFERFRADFIAQVRARGTYTLDVMGMKAKVTAATSPETVAGVPFTVTRTQYDTTGLSPAQAAQIAALQGTEIETRYGAWDELVGMAIGPASRADAEHLVTASRGPAQPRALPVGVAHLVDDAQARQDSFIEIIDVAAMAGKPTGDGVWLALGARPGTLHVRAGVSAAQIVALGQIDPRAFARP